MENLKLFHILLFLKIWIDLVSESADPGHTYTGWLADVSQKVKKSKSENIFLTASNLTKKHVRVTLLHDFKSSNRFGGSERATIED